MIYNYEHYLFNKVSNKIKNKTYVNKYSRRKYYCYSKVGRAITKWGAKKKSPILL